jgi:guanylate kinase
MSSDGAPGNLFVVSAPSGAGKTSLVASALARDPALAVAVSQTTRPRRPGEVEGRDYCFVTTGEFLRRAGAGEFLERADVFGHHYGTLRAPVAQRLAAGLDLILEIDWQGAAQVRRLMPECIGVFILPPSLAELERRMRARGLDPDAVIERRMAAAREELSHAAEFKYAIINKDFEDACQSLLAIVRAERLLLARQLERHPELFDPRR